MEQAKPILPDGVVYCTSALDAAQGADLLVVVTEWNEFRAIAPERLREAMRGDLIVDLRNMYESARLRAAGFRYQGIGRK
jgi:UDPglucose 6-dehydrogenase